MKLQKSVLKISFAFLMLTNVSTALANISAPECEAEMEKAVQVALTRDKATHVELHFPTPQSEEAAVASSKGGYIVPLCGRVAEGTVDLKCITDRITSTSKRKQVGAGPFFWLSINELSIEECTGKL